MKPSEIADLLLAQPNPAALTQTITALQPQISLDTIAALKQRVDAEKLRNASHALQIADIARLVAPNAASDEAVGLAEWARGNALYHLSRYREALAAYQQAQATYAALEKPLDVARLQINQIAVLQDIGAFEEALDLARQARATCEALGSSARRFLASLEMNLGATYQLLGRQDEALNAYERGRAIFAVLEEVVETARIDINRANVLQEMGRFAAAEALYRAARTTLTATGQEQEVARADHNLGKLAYRRGQYLAALRYFESAHAGFAAIPNPIEAAKVALYRSFVYRDLNLLEETITLAAGAEATLKRAGDDWLRAAALTNQGIGYQRLGAYAIAEKLLARARRIYQRRQAPTRVLLLDVERAALALDAGRVATARRIARRVTRTIDVETWPALAVRAEMLLARTLPAEAAEEASRAALQVAERYELPERAAAHHRLGQILEQAGDEVAAWRHYQDALHVVETQRAHLSLDELQIGFMDDKLPFYADALRLGQRLLPPAQLFALLNLAHSTPVVHAPQAAPPDQALPAEPEPDQRVAALREQWHWYQAWLEDPVDTHTAEETGRAPAVQRELHRHMRSVEAEIADLIRRRQIRSVAPGDSPASWTPEAAAVFLDQVQQRLAPHEILLHYFEDGDQIGAMLVSWQAVQLVSRLAPIGALRRVLQSWRFQLEHVFPRTLATPNHGATRAQLAHLYAALVGPIAGQLAEYTHIYLVLPPAWHDVPVAALFDGKTFLIERYGLTYLSAPAALLRALPPPRADQSACAIIVGYSEQGRLAHTIAETHRLATLLAPYTQVACCLEDEATGPRLRAELGRCTLLHLATHAVFRPDNPLFSWMRLADTRLTVADLRELTLPQRPLVVLSACETGRGLPRGGGLLGMGRGFLATSPAAQVMTDFYTQLVAVQPRSNPALALRDAQRAACARGDHPFGWAGFIFQQG